MPHNTRQAGQLDYRRARIELGTNRVQYHAAKLWNLLNHRYENYEFKKTLSEKHNYRLWWLSRILYAYMWLSNELPSSYLWLAYLVESCLVVVEITLCAILLLFLIYFELCSWNFARVVLSYMTFASFFLRCKFYHKNRNAFDDADYLILINNKHVNWIIKTNWKVVENNILLFLESHTRAWG